MEYQKLKNLYDKNNLSHDFPVAEKFLKNIETYFQNIDKINSDELDKIIKFLVDNNLSTIDNFIILMRYFKVITNNDLFIHLTRYTGMLDVTDNIVKRLKSLVRKEIFEEIMKDYSFPYLGVSLYELPNYIEDLMNRLNKNLDDQTLKKVLTGNNHDIPEKSQLREKIEYEHSNNLEEYLKNRHTRKVKELEEHLILNKVWFEQKITQEVVDLVKENQEILSAKLLNNKLYMTKIPYDTVNYLAAYDEIERKYYACHCPFAREAIKAGLPKIDSRFCYCSAGFEKFPFEVILGTKLEVKVLESALEGSDICRFEIDLSNVEYKK
jgi:hypothetical protein